MFFAIAAFLIPYTLGWGWGWWKFLVASLAILLLFRWAEPKTFASNLGVRVGGTDIGLGIFTFLVVGVIARHLIPALLRPLGYVPHLSESPTWKYLAVPFQTLNEEMVLRAFLLTSLARLVNRPIAVSAGVAAIFAALHFVLYRFGPPNTGLSIEALTTLFLVSMALNQLFFRTGNIAVPCGVHLGWNLTRFGNDWIAQSSGIFLADGRDFNLIEGNTIILALAATLLVLAIGASRLLGHAPNS